MNENTFKSKNKKKEKITTKVDIATLLKIDMIS